MALIDSIVWKRLYSVKNIIERKNIDLEHNVFEKLIRWTIAIELSMYIVSFAGELYDI